MKTKIPQLCMLGGVVIIALRKANSQSLVELVITVIS